MEVSALFAALGLVFDLTQFDNGSFTIRRTEERGKELTETVNGGIAATSLPVKLRS